ncbi:MAG: ATP-dependent Clp protease adapter ClpS [Magnetococcales bacterium]|nr:ATP-dependent Clp protease adapter ClpS [Magnetococcales bacterium]NGZ27092.1 ATP-dependent Clp protease adapter ClpS [Magnetococcales bacterium]
MSHTSHERETATITRSESETKEPPLFKVLILNDDFTPMDFVVNVLMKFFQKSEEEATRIMLQVHYQGSGICGIFTRDVAETKVTQVNQFSRSNGHPLKCQLEL